MNRNEWKFPMLGSQLVEPARKQREFHSERMSFWDAQLVEAKREMKDHGIEVVEYDEMNLNTRSYGGAMDVSVDPRLAKRVGDCQRKAKDHETQTHEFDRWVRAFEKNPDGRYELDIDDMNFFRI